MRITQYIILSILVLLMLIVAFYTPKCSAQEEYSPIIRTNKMKIGSNIEIKADGTNSGQKIVSDMMIRLESPSTSDHDSLWCIENMKDTSMTILEINISCDVDDQDVEIFYRPVDGGPATGLDTITVSTDGQDVFRFEGSPDSDVATIPDGYEIGIKKPTGASTWIRIGMKYEYILQEVSQ